MSSHSRFRDDMKGSGRRPYLSDALELLDFCFFSPSTEEGGVGINTNTDQFEKVLISSCLIIQRLIELSALMVRKTSHHTRLHEKNLTKSKTDKHITPSLWICYIPDPLIWPTRPNFFFSSCMMSALLICHSLTRCLFSLPFCWSQRRSPVSVLFFRLPGVRLKNMSHASCTLLLLTLSSVSVE